MEDVAAEAGVSRLIVYRHFGSKQELYHAVLERVAVRLQEEFTARLGQGRVAEGAVRAMLNVAREDPEGFRLLWHHASREGEFRDHADAIRARVVQGAESLLERLPVGMASVRKWAAATLVSYLVEATLAWLEHGRPDRDERFVAGMTASLPALVKAWASPEAQVPAGVDTRKKSRDSGVGPR